MTKFFYSHLIEVENVIMELDKLDLTKEQKIHLTGLVDDSLHHVVLDAILSGLTETNKKVFLLHLKENDKDKIWEFLGQKIDNIEDKIKKAAYDLRKDLKKDLKEASQRRFGSKK